MDGFGGYSNFGRKHELEGKDSKQHFQGVIICGGRDFCLDLN